MSKKKFVPMIVVALAGLSLPLATAALAKDSAPGKNKVTVCHKPGTPAEKSMEIPETALKGHLEHGDSEGPCGPPPPPPGCAGAVSDVCIDGDGIASPQPGGFEVQVGDPLTPFPDNLATRTGLDLFDRAPFGVLTQDDDLHAEDSALCPTALRNGVHDLGLDCKVLDINGDLANGESVTADCEFGGCSGAPFFLKFHDADGDGDWDQGEDLVADNNNNGVFD